MMAMLKKSTFFLWLLYYFSTMTVFSQDMTAGFVEVRKEVADSVGALYFYDSALIIINPIYYPIDTSLHHAHHYQALQQHGRKYASIGNTGLVYTPLEFNIQFYPQTQFGIHSFDAYRFTPQNLPYYKLNIPFTVLAYTLGKDREQVFTGKHYQQVRRNLGVGINFNIYNAMGSYERQKADNASIGFQALYRTNDKRYGVAGNFISNRFIHRENGGLLNPMQFEENLETDRSRISVNLNSAESRWRETNTYFKQYFHLTDDKITGNDSVVKTSSGLGTLVHSLNYQRLTQVYYDRNPKSNFYREILNDSTRTHDSLVLHTVANELQWNLILLDSDLLNISFNAGVSHVFMHMRYFETADTTSNANDYYFAGGLNQKYNQIIPFFRPRLEFGKRLMLEGNIQRITGDFRNGNQELKALASYRIGETDPIILNASIKNSLISPGLFYHIYQSNHFEWDNTFDKQRFNILEVSGKWRNTSAAASYTGINGFAYLDTLARPAWYSETFNILSVVLKSRLEWRRFIIDNKVTYQKVSDITALRLPELLVNSTLAYELNLFKGALQAMGGIEVFYNTAWKAPAYMPALRTFYLQDEKETGNYPYADIFINLRIKRARIFFIMQHVNEGLMGYDYYMIPNYPMPDRAFKFGLNWMFYD
jgi:hypothetical protein